MLIFDGDCGFCTSVANWAAARWRGEERAVAWQRMAPEELAAVGLTRDDVAAAAWWIDASMAEALAAGSGWSAFAGRLLRVPPARWLGAAAYPLIARWRHRLPGGTPACRL
ncbi:MAG TPA: DCC1-like thiol-disulfide oxidoreductase family protein [Candidatus Elarobacter sp.]